MELLDGTAAVSDQGAATLVLTVAYNGAPFAGFARQEGLMTVQGELERALPGARTVVARELTKKFEEFLRGTPEEIARHFASHPPRGEFVLLLNARDAESGEVPAGADDGEGDGEP